MTAKNPNAAPTTGEGASWSDPETDTSEEARFLGPDGQRILAILHRPVARPVVAGVVLCGSIYEDFHVNYRNQVLVARELARCGVASVRFHYRGFGNSDVIADGAVTFETMTADAATAAAWLTSDTRVEHTIWLGARIGVLIAAHHAEADDGAPLILWAPLHSGAEFFKGMSRASLLAGVRAEARQRQPTGSSEQRLRTEESVEMLGNRVRQTSYESLRVHALPQNCGPRQVLLVQLGTTDAITAQNQALVSRWKAAGAEVTVQHVRTRQLWSIPDRWEPVDGRPETESIVEGISSWTVATTTALINSTAGVSQ